MEMTFYLDDVNQQRALEVPVQLQTFIFKNILRVKKVITHYLS